MDPGSFKKTHRKISGECPGTFPRNIRQISRTFQGNVPDIFDFPNNLSLQSGFSDVFGDPECVENVWAAEKVFRLISCKSDLMVKSCDQQNRANSRRLNS